jgi:hypothetical protein
VLSKPRCCSCNWNCAFSRGRQAAATAARTFGFRGMRSRKRPPPDAVARRSTWIPVDGNSS